MDILLELSPNFSPKARPNKNVKFIIIHYTGMQSEIESLKRLKNYKYKVSCHYFISRNGKVIKMVDDNKEAWHAGKSKWKNFVNLNKFSIGIELVNKGHRFGYENFPNAQIKSLIKLCKKLKKKYKILDNNFLGHSDIAPLRKIDPGEKFPWKKLSKFKFGKWYKKIKLNEKFVEPEMKKKLFFKNLYKVGYRYFNINRRSKNDPKIIKAFQSKYLPNKVTGKVDKKTYEISHFLANSSKSS